MTYTDSQTLQIHVMILVRCANGYDVWLAGQAGDYSTM